MTALPVQPATLGLGAIVEGADGYLWVRGATTNGYPGDFRCTAGPRIGEWRPFEDIEGATVLDEGWVAA